MHKFWVTQFRTVVPDICGLELASYESPGTWKYDDAPRVVESFCIPGMICNRNLCIREVGCRCCLELHTLLYADIKHYI